MAYRKQLTASAGLCGRQQTQSHGRTRGVCPTAAMDYPCSTTEGTWAAPGAKHGALSAQGRSSFAPSAKPNLSQALILPGPPWAELPLGQQTGQELPHGISFVLTPAQQGSWLPVLPIGTNTSYRSNHTDFRLQL